MSFWNRIVSAVCWWLVAHYPGRYRVIGVDGVPYLGRLYLITPSKRFPGVFLHHFYRSDHDRDLHNHPWNWSFSVVLTGGYYEERAEEKARGYYGPGVEQIVHSGIKTRNINAPGINRLTGKSFHRVILKDLKNGAWTIFVAGKVAKDWGFMDRDTNKFIPHAQYVGQEFVDQPPNKGK